MALNIFNHWSFKCEQVTQRISKALDDPPPLGERMGIMFHLMMCKYCARYEKQMHFIKKLMHLHAQDQKPDDSIPSLSPEARKRMKESITRNFKGR